ncbi:MAG: FecR domain-containing protein [Polyangiales bacterium]
MRRAVIALCVLVAPVALAADPAATLSAADGNVDIGGAGATKGSPIASGSGVVTAANAHAEVRLKDGSRIWLAPSTTFYVLGKPVPKGKKPIVSDSTLVKGAVWTFASSAPMAAIVTPAGKVMIAASSEAKLHVEDGTTRVSVHKGKATVGGAEIAEGFGIKGKSKAKLPDSPKWTAPPKTLTTTSEENASVTGMIGGPGTATKWHVQVTMDAEMTDILVDSLIKADGPTLMVEQKLPPGHYFMRVAAIGPDGLESAWSAVAPATVTAATKKKP